MLALHDNERVLGSYRKTWVVFLSTALVIFFLATAPLFLLAIGIEIFAPYLPPLPASLAIFLFALWWWGLWIAGFAAFTKYYLDVFVVTNERIIHVDQKNLFSRTIAELRLERVQDVTIEQHGLLATFLHYGDILVQTAGEQDKFLFTAIPRPTRVKEQIMAAQRAATTTNRAASSP